jgi:hypothetical protein
MKHPSVEKHKQYLRDKFMDEAITRLGAAEGCAYVNQVKPRLEVGLASLEDALLTDEEFENLIVHGGVPRTDF